MKLLVSVISPEEIGSCISGKADIIDVKNPQEGSLGGHSPKIVNEIRGLVPENILLSAAIGDIKNKPGLIAQAACGLAHCKVNYIKFGLYDSFSLEQAIYLVKTTVDAVKSINPAIKIVVCGYADAANHNIILPEAIPTVGIKGNADVVMLDTLTKEPNKGLFDYLNIEALERFQKEAAAGGLETALAGKLTMQDLATLKQKDLCDIAGVRTLVCEAGRRTANININKITQAMDLIKV